ncbi:MAG: hypothetical protein AAF213_10710 [Pseudomonadota bacterium]
MMRQKPQAKAQAQSQAQVIERRNRLLIVVSSSILVVAMAYVLLASSLARAETMDAKNVLRDAWLQFERSASQDPLTQQRIATCIGEKAIASGTFGEYSSYDPRDWQSINTKGLDLGALSKSVSQAIRTCQNQSGAGTYR